MSLAMHCDAPGCKAWTRTMLEAWIEVYELPSRKKRDDALHFCSWDCLLRHGATKEPITHIDPHR